MIGTATHGPERGAAGDDGAASTGGRRLPHTPLVTHWLYAVFIANVLWQPIFNPAADVSDWVTTGVIVALFLPLWAVVPYSGRRSLWWIVGGMVALGTVGTLVNVGTSVVFVYAAAGAAQAEREVALRWFVGLSALLLVLMAASPVPFPYQVISILPPLVLIWVVGLSENADVQRRAEADRLRIDNVRVEQLATAAERERIALDLHDLLGQSLTGLVVRAQLVAELASSDADAAVAEAARLEDGARTALEQVRAAVSGLHDVDLDQEAATARRVLAAANVDARVVLPDSIRPSPLVERTLALALREAVTNVVRHADAARCSIEVTHDGRTWQLAVADDGRGGPFEEGNGLRGMRERTAAVGGQLQHRTGRGTSLLVTVPA